MWTTVHLPSWSWDCETVVDKSLCRNKLVSLWSALLCLHFKLSNQMAMSATHMNDGMTRSNIIQVVFKHKSQSAKVSLQSALTLLFCTAQNSNIPEVKAQENFDPSPTIQSFPLPVSYSFRRKHAFSTLEASPAQQLFTLYFQLISSMAVEPWNSPGLWPT